MSTVETMACNELVERVTEYLDAALADTDRTRFEGHVAECPGCFEILEQFRAVITTTGRLRPEDVATVDPEIHDQLLEVFRAWRSAAR